VGSTLKKGRNAKKKGGDECAQRRAKGGARRGEVSKSAPNGERKTGGKGWGT